MTELYRWGGPQLGYVSFRLGANFADDAATGDSVIPLGEYVENAYGHGLPEASVLLPGHLAFRAVPIKSPVCIPFQLIRTIGLLDERLAPYAHDDTDYAIRCLAAGYRNAVFALRFYSDVKWGGTRTSPHPRISAIQKRNMDQIRIWHGGVLGRLCEAGNPLELVAVPGMSNPDEDRRALAAWEESRRQLGRAEGTRSRVFNKVRSIVRGVLASTFSRA